MSLSSAMCGATFRGPSVLRQTLMTPRILSFDCTVSFDRPSRTLNWNGLFVVPVSWLLWMA